MTYLRALVRPHPLFQPNRAFPGSEDTSDADGLLCVAHGKGPDSEDVVQRLGFRYWEHAQLLCLSHSASANLTHTQTHTDPSPFLVAIPDIPLWRRFTPSLPLVCSVYTERERVTEIKRSSSSSSSAIMYPSILLSICLRSLRADTRAKSSLQRRLISSELLSVLLPLFPSILVFGNLFLLLPTPA